MENNEREQFVDDLLDASLARYSNVMPRPGLDGRVLSNAKAVRTQRRWMMWAGWVAAGAVATLIVLGVFSRSHLIEKPASPHTPEVANAPSVHPNTPGTTSVPQPVRVTRAVPTRRALRSVLALARQESTPTVFPSPSPMTEQEKLLAQYVRTNPTDALSVPALDSNPIRDLEIEPLKVAPLESLETESNEEK